MSTFVLKTVSSTDKDKRYLVYFPGVLAGLPFGKLTGERIGFVSGVGLWWSNQNQHSFFEIILIFSNYSVTLLRSLLAKAHELLSLRRLVTPMFHITGSQSSKIFSELLTKNPDIIWISVLKIDILIIFFIKPARFMETNTPQLISQYLVNISVNAVMTCDILTGKCIPAPSLSQFWCPCAIIIIIIIIREDINRKWRF